MFVFFEHKKFKAKKCKFSRGPKKVHTTKTMTNELKNEEDNLET